MGKAAEVRVIGQECGTRRAHADPAMTEAWARRVEPAHHTTVGAAFAHPPGAALVCSVQAALLVTSRLGRNWREISSSDLGGLTR